MAAAALRTAFGIQYRQLSGFLAGMPGGGDSPHYLVLCRKMNRLELDLTAALSATQTLSLIHI